MSPCQQKKDKECPKKDNCPPEKGKKEEKSNASVKADTKVNAAGNGKKGNWWTEGKGGIKRQNSLNKEH